MKAQFVEYDGSFHLELVPETTEETLRAIRLGLMAKRGASTFVSFSRTDARLTVTFDKNKRSNNYIRK